jgi:3-hydroxyacyl-[acyl-carrier-protein] dehydratase
MSVTMTEPASLDIQQIMDTIPHRYPFLLVDRVTELQDGQCITGYKNVSMNEPFFQGHFPHRAIFPGVLQLEALAQLSGVLVANMPEGKGKLGVFTGVDKVRFRRMVVPGDRFEMRAELVKARFPIYKFQVTGSVDGETSVEGEIMFSMVNP